MRNLIFLLLMLFCKSLVAFGADVKLVWDPPVGYLPDGYKVYYGTATGTYGAPTNVGNVLSYTVSGLNIGTWFFAVTAFDAAGNESGFSNEVSTTIAPTNQAPTVSAGPDQTVILPAQAILDATATDDGPIASLTFHWTVVSGAGTATFADPNGLDTSAAFSAAGIYVLRITAFDGALSASDDVMINVQIPPPTGLKIIAQSSTIGTTSARFEWTTNVPADGAVLWDRSAALGNLRCEGVLDLFVHTVRVGGLKSQTFYYYQLRSITKDGGQIVFSDVSSFITR